MDAKKPVDKGMVIGGLLVGFGALLMLQTFGVIGSMWQLTVALAFLAGASVFGYVFLNDRRHWWALFPAAALGFIGLVIASDMFFPRVDFEGPLFLGGMGLAFLVVYATNQQHLWAIIPGGALVTLGTVAAVEQVPFLRWIDGGSIFFLGLALTFTMLYVLAPVKKAWSWALIVAAVLGGIGVLTIAGTLMKFIFPLALILIGAYMLKDRGFDRNGNNGNHNDIK
jgi:hypothetical protein